MVLHEEFVQQPSYTLLRLATSGAKVPLRSLFGVWAKQLGFLEAP